MERNIAEWRLKPSPGANRLHGAQRTLPEIFESSPIGIALLGMDGRFLLVNPALCQMLACDREAMGQMTVASLSHPDDANRFVSELRRLRCGEITAVRAERHLRRPDGRGLWAFIHVSPVLKKRGGPVNFLAHVTDISDRVRAQQEAELRTIQQTALTELGARAIGGTSPRLIMDHAVRVVACCLAVKSASIFEVRGGENLVLAATVGSSGLNGSTPSPSAVESLARYGLAAAEPVLVSDLRGDDRFVPSLPAQGLVSTLVVPVPVAGRAHAMLSAHSPEPDRFTDEDVNFVLAVANTVAAVIERRFHEEAQERLNRQERLATMGQLTAGVAHDFNNIVSTIGLYADLVGSDHSLCGPSRDHLGVIQDQTERAKSLVWQVLDFVQGRPIVRTQIDVSLFFSDFLPVLRRQVPSGISIALHHDSAPYWAHVDPARLQQIVMNLVTNACDAMSGTGTLTITLSRRPAPEDISGSPGRPGLEVRISDTGSGFAADVLEKALEPFFTTKAPDEGTGLGLAQVQSLVAQHGGHLAIDSALGEGTTVTVWLAESEPDNCVARDPLPAALRSPSGRSKT